MHKQRIYLVFFLFLWDFCASEYYDDQPKFFTQNGDFIIESAVDKNISFRLKGRGYLNVNDLNIMNLLPDQSSVTGTNEAINSRVKVLEDQMGGLMSRPISPAFRRNVLSRLSILEQRSNSGPMGNASGIERRVRRLEGQLNRLIQRLNADNCSSNPCRNGGTCMNTFGGYVCRCTDAWEGANCEDDVNECANFAGTDLGCQNMAICENFAGGYKCRCQSGWVGMHCTRRTVDCLQSSYELCGHGACVHSNDANGFRCICDQGWIANGSTPACNYDVNECLLPTPHCSIDPEVMCINIPGSYTCGPCPHGYIGNGHYCKDVDECEENNGGCSTSPFVACINTRGSSKCASCPFGYSGDGRVCIRTGPGPATVVPVPPYLPPAPMPYSRPCDPHMSICHPLARCLQNRLTSAISCICPLSYTGDGYGPNGCVRSNSTFNACSLNSCQNGGTCHPVGVFGFRCECPPDTLPPRCIRASNACSSNPCLNGGTCLNRASGTYLCLCPTDKYGRNCQLERRTCGGVLNAFNGTLKYPLSNVYPHNSRCAWLIKTDEDKVLNITFTKFNLEPSRECRFDWLQIHDGRSSASYMIGRFCGSELPKNGNIISTTNMLYLWFRSDNSTAHDGFELTWNSTAPVCGFEKTVTEHGTITSPGSPGNYPPNRDCIWKLMAPPNKRIQLHFFTMQLEAHENCQFDYLAVHNGLSTNGGLLEKYCNTTHPQPVTSSSNELTLHFHSDEDGTDAGFQIHYSVIEGFPGCGGTFTTINGEFGSPIQNGAYPKNIECHYIIKLPKGMKIRLQFLSFNLEHSHSCSFDYVEVYEGPNENAPKVGRWCGNRLPPEYSSLTNELMLLFRTDWSFNAEGFRVKYETVCGGKYEDDNGVIMSPFYPSPYENARTCHFDIEAPLAYMMVQTVTVTDESIGGEGFVATYSFIDGRNMCGGKFYGTSGTVTSPNFPDEYPSSRDCIYEIHAPSGKQIELNVKVFELEENSGCTFDSLEIRNGKSDKSPLIGIFCGSNIVPNIRSFSNVLYLRFRTDATNERKGFKIEYNTLISGCGGTIRNAQRGSLTSPNYPEPYGANMQCDYRIHVAAGPTISLIVTDLEMETDADCSMDYLSIYDGLDASAKHIGTYCQANQLVQIETTSNDVFIRMVSDISNQGRGFEIKFNANCQREIRDLRGVIESPNFPENYPNFANCSWRIIPPLGNRIFMEFSHLDVERSWGSECNFDLVTIEEHDNNDMVLRSNKYCSELPKPLNTSNTVVIKFETDFSNTAGGFHLEYEIQGCGGTLNKPDGRFASPNYPSPNPHDTHCQWVIEVDYGHLIQINFSDFDFEASNACYQDGLVVSSDRNASKVLTKFCGSIHNKTNGGVVTSNSNKVYVHFFSDLSYAGRGFLATYTSIPTKCGGLYTLPEGNISSMNYPNNYESNSHCEWLIRTETSHSVSLQFSDFDLPNSPNCSADVVRIYDGSEKRDDKLLLKVCGTENRNGTGFDKPLRSESNEMLVVMDSDDSFESKGFAASYGPRCGSKINTSSSGILEIGHNLRWIAQDCQWVITAEDPNQHVSLTILHIDNEPVFQKYIARLSNQTLSPCIRKIFIYDGTSTSSPKIVEICSNKHPPTIVSEGNSLTIALDTVIDNDFAFTFDLKAAYSVLDNACGGDFTSVYGQIASPGYPKSYKNNIECEWTLKASPGNEMTLSIDMLDIDETENCNGDYLEIRRTNSVGEILRILCGTNIPATLPSSNIYWLKFRSDNDGVGRGFKAEYNYAKLVEQNGSSGVITSPMYPSYIYFTLDSYKWRITVERGSVIRITVDNCILKRDSRIAFYDGYDSSAGLLATIETDNIATEPIVSTTNVVLLEFQINTFSESKFKLNWAKVPKESIDSAQTSNGTNTLNCTSNSIYTVGKSDLIKIHSNGWPNGYESNKHCKWTFLPGAPGYHVALSFTNIDLEPVEGCLADYVRVGNSNGLQNFNMSTNMCSMTSFNRRSRFHGTPNLQLTFDSDFSVNRTGFEAVVLLDCGGSLDAASGILNQNMTGRVANASMFWLSDICTWNINVRRGNTIQFQFEQLNLEKMPDGSCGSHILIRDGPHEDSPFLGDGKYCGNAAPESIPKTSSNRAIVQFNRWRSLNKKEFTLKYQQIGYDCGGYMTLNQKQNTTIITTPNYPNIPRAHIECIWRVTAPSGELLKIDFLERFDLTPTPNCVTEYLEVREGSTSNAPVIGKYCGQMPQPIFLSSNMVRLYYMTDVSFPRNGFQLKVSFVKCGKSMISNKGFLNSPGYPGKGAYPTQSTCDFYVTGRSGTIFNLTFVDLHLPSANNCSEVDHIEVYSLLMNGPPMLITQLCGESIPNAIMTYTSKFLIRFVTKSANGLYRGYRIAYQTTSDACGGTIEATTGIVQSPGYPLARESLRACEWFITVPKGRRVKVEIIDFDVQPLVQLPPRAIPLVAGPTHQKLVFYNDFFETRIATNGNDTTVTIFSTDNKMTIQSIIRSNVGHRGFKLRFTSEEPSICEGDLNDDSGMFQTPENVSSFFCEFARYSGQPLIASQPDRGTISIKIRQIDISINRTNCLQNVFTGIVVVYRGNERKAIQSKCPPKYENIASPLTSTKIAIKNSPFFKFVFDYKIHRCGGVFSIGSSSRITQPSFDLDYGEFDCAWQFSSRSDRSLQIIVSSSALNCETDYISIYIGDSSANRPRVSRICGDAVTNQTIQIRSQYAFIQYHSDQYQTTNRFTIDLTTSDGICGGMLDAPNYVFSSPKNGTKYPFNIHCEWILRAQNGFHIGLYFPERFMIEQSDLCSKDYLQVFDKINETWKPLAKFCGRGIPNYVNSTSRFMKVVFHTDNTIDGDGFTAAWNENCGGNFTATSQTQTITSPRHPDRYPKNIHCHYSIRAPSENENVNIKFLKFDLEETARTCNFDNVTIFKAIPYMPTTDMELVGTFCWHDSVTTFRNLKQIDVKFQTDGYIERSGFVFEYRTDDCGGTITQPTTIGSIKDESRNAYLSMTTCIWNITAPSDKKIVIRFEEFDLEKSPGCFLDYVDVFEGDGVMEKNRKAKLCGNLTQHAPSVNIHSNKAIVKFSSDGSVEEKGFRALILFVKNCDGIIGLTPNQRTYTLNKLVGEYESFLNCEYSISAPKGFVVQAKFNQFHLMPCGEGPRNGTCTCDYVNILDGGGPFAEILGTYCGFSNPPNIVSTRNAMFLRYVTDDVGFSTGFSVEFSMIESSCGEQEFELNDTRTSVEIKMPKTGNTYLPDLNCLWTFTTGEEKLIEIRFDRFDLESSSDNQCNSDYLEIIDDEAHQYISEGLGENTVFSGADRGKTQYFYFGKQWPVASHRYCGSGKPMDYLSQMRKTHVRFKTNEAVGKSGFTFTASIFNACARNYTRPQGRLYSKKPNDCKLYISVPDNYMITLYFTIMDFQALGGCTETNTPLKVYNDRNNELLKSYCGDSSPQPLFTTTNRLRLKFKKVPLVFQPNELYDITYLASNKGSGCGGELFNYGGTFTSPGYPNTDLNNTDCTWTINVPMNLIVAIQFQVFDLGARSCDVHYLEIIESDESIESRKFCGGESPAPYRAQSNQLKVHFKSSANFDGTGWIINFMAVHKNTVITEY